MKKYLPHFFELVRFGIVGGAATATHGGVAYLLAHFTALPLLLINICAFCVAFGVSFLGHYHWTFQAKGPKRQSLVRFFVIAVSGLGVSEVILSLLIAFSSLNKYIELTISIFAIPVVTYALSKSWAFRKEV